MIGIVALMEWIHRKYTNRVLKIRFRNAKKQALQFHEEDGKQYHVWDNEGTYIVVSRESIKMHNQIAKKDSRYKHINYVDVCKKALYSTPLKGRIEI